METKDPMSTETSRSKPDAEAREPESTATSSDTLSDIEQTEKVSAPKSNEQSSGGSGSNDAPSPDGQFDDSRSNNSGVGDPGPM
ncbi:MAG TPA: hypothetical protein VF658_13015 [Pyrinomonadaceae bacterium]|jgi:hypothetical protein